MADEVRLEAETINRRVAVAQVLQQRQYVPPPISAFCRGILETVFVEAERGRGIGRARQPKRQIHMLVAEEALPDRAAVAGLEAVLRLDRLVDRVPGPDLAAIALDQSADMTFESISCRGGGRETRHPIRVGRIPDERVPMHDHVVARGEIDDRIRAGKIE